MADMIYGELIAAASVTQSQLTGQRNHSAGAVQLNQMDGERNHSFMYLQNQYNGERSVFVMPNQINGESNAQQQQTNDPNGLSRISLPDVHRVDGLTADDMDVVALSLAARADVLNLDTVDEDYPDELDLQREDEEPAPDPILLERLMREEHFANSSKSNNGNAIISMSEASSVSELITSNGEGKASEACAP
ncbi:hypothetical protein O6H91_10G047300 [Diphasiastrum complanatum]|nr:hypothetical protein O6H91_10G047300 [Diphasiastrum complanatum]